MALEPSAAILLAALVYGAFRQGAYHADQHLIFGVLVCAAGVVCAFGSHGRSMLLRAGVAVSPLVLASIVSLVLASDSSNASSTFVTLGLVAIGFAVGQQLRPASRLVALDVLLAVLAIVAVTAIHGVAAHHVPWGRITGDVWRGSSSITYSNAAATVLATALVIGVWRALRSESRLHAALATLAAIALLSTQSRAGFLSVALVVPVIAYRTGLATFVRSVAPVAVGAILGSSVLLRLAPVASTPRPVLSWLMVLVGCAITWAAWPHRMRLAHPVRLAVAVGGLGVVGLLASPLRGRLTLRSATTATGPDGSVAFGDRGNLWSSAWQRVSERPLVGHGPGNVDLRWTESGREFTARFVHNEYLELVVTHGIVGLVAFAASGLIVRRVVSGTAVIGGALAAIGVVLVHSIFDFLWHVPLLPVTAAFVLGVAFRSHDVDASSRVVT